MMSSLAGVAGPPIICKLLPLSVLVWKSLASFLAQLASFALRRGNIRYRMLIAEYKPQYTAASRVDKVRLCTLLSSQLSSPVLQRAH